MFLFVYHTQDSRPGLYCAAPTALARQRIRRRCQGNNRWSLAIVPLPFVVSHCSFANSKHHRPVRNTTRSQTTKSQRQTTFSRASAERQQSDIARLLDSRGEPPLVRRAHAAEPPGHDLAAFRHELREQAIVLVINGVNLLHAKLAHLLAAEILASAFARDRKSVV